MIMKEMARTASAYVSRMVFRSLEIRRAEPEPDGAALVLANHGGGLADILAVLRSTRRFPRFLARDVIWKFPIAKQVMDGISAIPVHRRQDHGGQADNSGMFDEAFKGLAEGDLLVIYPEGESVAEPRLAPLRTGAARILLGAMAEGIDTAIVPMGLHYYDISVLRGRCMVEVGPTVRTSEILSGLPELGPVSEGNHQLVRAVTEALSEHLRTVVDEYDDWEQRIRFEAAAAVYLDPAPRVDPRRVQYGEIADLAHRIAESPDEVRKAVDDAMRSLHSELELLGVSEEALPYVAMINVKLAGRAALLLLLAPVAAYGLAVNGLPMLGVRAISLTGVAPATAASLKPAFAFVAFHSVWAGLAWWGYKREGPWLAAALGLSGPISLGVTMLVAERGELVLLTARAARRAKGLKSLSDQWRNARQAVVDAVARVVADSPDQPRASNWPLKPASQGPTPGS